MVGRETIQRIAVIKPGIGSKDLDGVVVRCFFISRARVTMKIRLIALAGVAALALSTPAMAAQGWYLGLGAGWDQQTDLKFRSVPSPTSTQIAKSKAGALVAGSV